MKRLKILSMVFIFLCGTAAAGIGTKLVYLLSSSQEFAVPSCAINLFVDALPLIILGIMTASIGLYSLRSCATSLTRLLMIFASLCGLWAVEVGTKLTYLLTTRQQFIVHSHFNLLEALPLAILGFITIGIGIYYLRPYTTALAYRLIGRIMATRRA